MAPAHCRFGILGAATIARKNWKAIRNAGNSTLVAVASRDKGRAQAFIDDCQAHASFPVAPAAVAGYDELLARKDIDAVYIPLPTGVRGEWVRRAAAAGKHVLCEKPCGVNAAELRGTLEACRQAKVQFMDGVMFMHSARLPLVRRALDDGESIGAVKRITSAFSFLASDDFLRDNIRVSADLEPLGALGDLGWYNIRFSLWTMKEQLPEKATGRILARHGSGGQPVPIEFSGELLFAGGASASFHCSFNTENHQWANVAGTKGSLHMSDFVLPFYGCESAFELSKPVFDVNGCDFNMQGHTRRLAAREYSNSARDSQETNMFRTFAGIVLSGKLEPHWAEQALKTQQVLDACLQSARSESRLVAVG